jgi:hypothetical protein
MVQSNEFMKKKAENIVKASAPKPQKPKRTAKGPEPERLKIEGNWIHAIDHTLAVKRPPTGWPK